MPGRSWQMLVLHSLEVRQRPLCRMVRRGHGVVLGRPRSTRDDVVARVVRERTEGKLRSVVRERTEGELRSARC